MFERGRVGWRLVIVYVIIVVVSGVEIEVVRRVERWVGIRRRRGGGREVGVRVVKFGPIFMEGIGVGVRITHV